MIGLRFHYFTVPWNVFDFLLVLASILGILMEDVMLDFPVSPTLLRVVRVFRIGRILRLIKVIVDDVTMQRATKYIIDRACCDGYRYVIEYIFQFLGGKRYT